MGIVDDAKALNQAMAEGTGHLKDQADQLDRHAAAAEKAAAALASVPQGSGGGGGLTVVLNGGADSSSPGGGGGAIPGAPTGSTATVPENTEPAGTIIGPAGNGYVIMSLGPHAGYIITIDPRGFASRNGDGTSGGTGSSAGPGVTPTAGLGGAPGAAAGGASPAGVPPGATNLGNGFYAVDDGQYAITYRIVGDRAVVVSKTPSLKFATQGNGDAGGGDGGGGDSGGSGQLTIKDPNRGNEAFFQAQVAAHKQGKTLGGIGVSTVPGSGKRTLDPDTFNAGVTRLTQALERLGPRLSIFPKSGAL